MIASPSLRPWWCRLIPGSWYMAEGDQERRYRDRGGDHDDLDDTRPFRRRYDDNPPPQTPRVQVPFGVIVTVTIYFVGQLIAGIWWAATLQSNLDHELVDRAKEENRLWQSIETYRLEVQALRVEIARSGASKRTTKDEE